MGKSGTKQNASRKKKDNTSSRNIKNLEVLVTPPAMHDEADPKTPPNEDFYGDDDYVAEIAVGAASPILVQPSMLKMIGGQDVVTSPGQRPTLVEITKESMNSVPVKAQEEKSKAPNHKTTDIKDLRANLKSRKRNIADKVNDLDEFRDLSRTPTEERDNSITVAKLRSPVKVERPKEINVTAQAGVTPTSGNTGSAQPATIRTVSNGDGVGSSASANTGVAETSRPRTSSTSSTASSRSVSSASDSRPKLPPSKMGLRKASIESLSSVRKQATSSPVIPGRSESNGSTRAVNPFKDSRPTSSPKKNSSSHMSSNAANASPQVNSNAAFDASPKRESSAIAENSVTGAPVTRSRSSSKGSQKFEDLESEFAGMMADLDRPSMPTKPNVQPIDPAKPKEIEKTRSESSSRNGSGTNPFKAHLKHVEKSNTAEKPAAKAPTKPAEILNKSASNVPKVPAVPPVGAVSRPSKLSLDTDVTEVKKSQPNASSKTDMSSKAPKTIPTVTVTPSPDEPAPKESAKPLSKAAAPSASSKSSASVNPMVAKAREKVAKRAQAAQAIAQGGQSSPKELARAAVAVAAATEDSPKVAPEAPGITRERPAPFNETTTGVNKNVTNTAPTTSKSTPLTMEQYQSQLIVGVAVVGFHHTRGPEVEYWAGPNGNQANLWPYLPFQSLPDGSHCYEENICYFTVLYDPSTGTAPNPTPERDQEGLIIEKSNFNKVETLFGISCTRQISAADLDNKDEDVTRSTVQKSIVVLARKPVFGPIKEKLRVVTRTYFDQRDFADRKIIDNLYDSVTHMFKSPQNHSEGDFLVGTNPRELLHDFGTQVMILFKAMLMEKNIAFYAADTETLCTTQFTLISLIPNLLSNLQDCGSPLLSTYETKLSKPTFLRTSDRSSLLSFLGLPLQVFAAGGMFTPFIPLQLIEELKQPEMQYGMFGSTNKVVFTQGLDYDILVDVDNHKVVIENAAIKKALELTSADKAFINSVLQNVNATWNHEDAEHPLSMTYNGSDDYIRHAFEDYLIGLLASAKYNKHLEKQGNQTGLFSRNYPSNPLKPFNPVWASQWQQTNNYRIFNKFTDEELFDIVEPLHVGLLKNRKRTDAISEVRGVTNEHEPEPAADTSFSGKFFNMFGWSSSSASTPAQVTPSQTPQSVEESPQTPKKPQTPIMSPSEGPNGSPKKTPLSPRKLFFWK